MPDTADDANNRNDLMSKFQKLQSETNEIQSIFSKQSSFDATSLFGNRMLKDFCESMINQQNEQNKFNEELLKTMKDQNAELANRQNEQDKFIEENFKTMKNQNSELKLQSEQVLKEIRSMKSDLEESKKQHSLEIQSMKKLMSAPDSVDSSLFPDTSVKNDTSARVITSSEMFQKSDRTEFTAKKRNISIFRGWNKFVDWKILEKDYVRDGKLRAEIRVKITKTTGLYGKPLRNFYERNKSFSDVVIVVKETKFYVFKLLLVAHSSYFKSLLSEISPNSEVELNDVEPEDFQVFLEVLYGEPATNEKTVEVILYMAEKYDTQAVTRKCEDFLIDESRKKMKKKLQLATKYKLEKLKNNINTAAEIRSVISSEISDMEPSTMASLFQKSLALLE